MWRLVNPFEAAVALAAMVIGSVGLLSEQPANSVLMTLWPGWGITVYFLALALGGLAMLIGMTWTLTKVTHARVLLWRCGLLMIASAWITYGLAVVIMSSTAAIGGTVLAIIGLAALIRLWQLRRATY
jgi:hypothetical protein